MIIVVDLYPFIYIEGDICLLLKILGWLFIPYIMILFQWKKVNNLGRILGTIWAIIALLTVVFNGASNPTTELTTTDTSKDGTTVEATLTPSPSATIEPVITDSPVPTEKPVKTGSPTYDVTLNFPAEKYPETAAHIASAIEEGESATCTIDRNGADVNRDESLSGIETKDGFDRDEWPMAMCAEGGTGADVEYVTPADNRGAGSWVANQLEQYEDGTRVLFVIEGSNAVAVKTTPQATIKPAPTVKPTVVPSKKPKPISTPKPTQEPVEEVYYANCTAVRDAGAAPIYEDDPGYSFKLDRDKDGVACE